jgi:hypothetical protein
MKLGNIDRTPLSEVLLSERRAAVRRDAMVEPLCRRCRGRLFIFDTTPLSGAAEQTIATSAGDSGRARKASTGSAGAGRMEGPGRMSRPAPARSLRLSFQSDFESSAALSLGISAFDPGFGGFPETNAVFAFHG